eukprot:scaffold47086_cov60-Phaeocystis_antarctica.AAC.3
MVLVPGARACLLLQCLAQWVLLLLELEAWLLQRVRVAAVAVPIAAAWLVTLALVLAPAERVSALDRLLLRLLGRELIGSAGGGGGHVNTEPLCTALLAASTHGSSAEATPWSVPMA